MIHRPAALVADLLKLAASRSSHAAAVAAVVATMAFTSVGVYAQKTPLMFRYATAFGPQDEPYQTAAEWFRRVTEQVEAKTKYSVKFTIYAQGSVLKIGETLGGIQDGRVDMGLIAPSLFPSQLPLSQVVTLPFLTEDAYASMKANADLSQSNPMLAGEWSKLGLVPVLFGPAQNAATSFKVPVKDIAELKGKRVRATGYHADALRAAGASPVAIPASEIYQAIQTGVLDAFSSSPMGNQVTAQRIQEVAKNFVDLGMGQYTLAVNVVVRKSVWDSTPAEVRKIMMEQAAAVADSFSFSNMSKLDVEACNAVKAAGGSVVRLPDAQIASWKAQSQAPIIEKYVAVASKVGSYDAAAVGTFLQTYQATLKKYEGKNTAYVDGMTACRGRL